MLLQAQQVASMQQNSIQQLPQRKIRRNFDVISRERIENNPYGKKLKKAFVKSNSEQAIQKPETINQTDRKDSISSPNKTKANIQVIMRNKQKEPEKQESFQQFINQHNTQSRNQLQQINTTSNKAQSKDYFFTRVAIKQSPEKQVTKMNQTSTIIKKQDQKLQYSLSSGLVNKPMEHKINKQKMAQSPQNIQLQLDRTLIEKLVQNQNKDRINVMSRKQQSRNPQPGQFNEPILNIRTAKDINIYNNSFILTSGIQSQASFENRNNSVNIISNKGIPESNLGHSRSYNQSSRINADSSYNSGRVLPPKAQNLQNQRRPVKRGSKLTLTNNSDGFKISLSNLDHSTVQNLSRSKIGLIQQSAREQDQLKPIKQLILKKQFKEALKELVNMSNDQAVYLKGICYLDSGESILDAKQCFTQCYQMPEAQLMLAICEKKIGNISLCQQIIDNCIQNFPNYSEAYLMKAQQLVEQTKYQQALSVYQTCPASPTILQSMGHCYKMLKNYDQAIEKYKIAIQITKSISLARELKSMRGIVYFKKGMFQESLSDFQDILSADPSNIKIHFYLARVLQQNISNKNSNYKDMMLHYEVVASSADEYYSGNASYQVAKINIGLKRFHEAQYALNRGLDNHFQSKRFTLLKDFVEGVIQLTKRKIKKGVQQLNDLVEILKDSDSLMTLALTYRAYGFIAIEKYEQALQDIKKVKKTNGFLDVEALYNQNLSKGILKMDNEDYLMASKFFQKAWKIFPQNKDAYLLQVISIVRSYTYSLDSYNIDQQIKFDKVMETIIFLDKAIANCDPNREPSLYFFRGLLYFQLHHFNEALQDFNLSILNDQETTPIYYLARGRTFACMSLLNEAIKDLTFALEIDQALQEAYIYRGRCAFLLGDNNLAFLDFQKLILNDPKNPVVHVWAGKLLMTTGAYQDAIKAFENADSIEVIAESHYQKARCYIAQNDIEQAIKYFEVAFEIVPDDVLLSIDIQVLELLQNIIQGTSKLESILKSMNELIKLAMSGKLENIKQRDASLSVKIIPNADRITIEKTIALNELYKQDKEAPKKRKHQKSEIEQYEITQKYYESIFELKDLILYRAVIQVYLKNYQEAISDFKTYEQCASETIAEDTLNSLYSEKEVKSDSINNILVCLLLIKDFEGALVLCKQLQNSVFKQEVIDYIQNEQIKQFTQTTDYKLSDLFKPIQLNENLQIKLNFRLPTIRPPNMIPNVDELLIQSEFSLKQIDAPMPEAPWLNKCPHNKIQFVTRVNQATTPKFFQIKSQETKQENDLSIKTRLLRENQQKDRSSSLVSQLDLQKVPEQKCKECAQKPKQFEVQEDTSAQNTDRYDEESIVKMRASNKQPKLLSDKFQDVSPQGRYDDSDIKESVLSDDELRKDPVGLDQCLLAGNYTKKRQRKVSNLSLLGSDLREEPKIKAKSTSQ